MRPATQHNPSASDDQNIRDSENGGEQQQADGEEADIQPFRAIRSMDGNDWRYTTAVLTTMTLGITMLFFERGFLEGRETGLTGRSDNSQLDMTSIRIIRYLILLAFAMGIGTLSWLLLMPNLQTIDNTRFALLRARKWIFWSTLGFAITNLGAILNGLESQAAFEWEYDRGKFVSPVAHYLILVFFFMALLVTDVLFVRVVLFPFLDGLVLPSVDNQGGYEFRIHRDVLVGLRDGNWGEASFFGKVWMILARTSSFAVDMLARLVISLLIGFYKYVWNPTFKFLSWVCKAAWRVVQTGSRSISDSFTGCLRKSSCCPFFSEWMTLTTTTVAQKCDSMETHLTSYIDRNRNPAKENINHPRNHHHRCSCPLILRVIFSSLGTATASWILAIKRKITRLRPGVEERGNQFWESIKEEDDFRHSSWVKASVLTSVILLFYFGFTLVAIFQGAFKDVYKKHRDCALQNPKLADFFLRSAGFGETSLISSDVLEDTTPENVMNGSIENLTDGEILAELQELVKGIRDVGEMQCLNIQDRRTRLLLSAVRSFETNQALVEETSPSDHFSRKSIGETAIVTDVILENLNWSIWLGFVVGLVIGARSLLTIFAQYKRVAMALRTGFFDAIPEELRKSLNFGPLVLNSKGRDPRWNKLLKVYQLSQMVFFTGMLVSTAVLQLVVFGAMVSLLVALVASLFDRDVLRILSPVLVFLLALLIAWLVNNVIAVILAESLLLDGYIIRHEMTFLFFSLVFSMVHLVLGVLLALFRLLILLLSTLSMVNRLDINLLLTWQYRDIGHRSFIAMVLLNHVNELSSVCRRKPHGGGPNDERRDRDDVSKYPEIHVHLGGIKAASERLRDFDAKRRLEHATGASGSGGYVPPERVESIFRDSVLPPDSRGQEESHQGSGSGNDRPKFPPI